MRIVVLLAAAAAVTSGMNIVAAAEPTLSGPNSEKQLIKIKYEQDNAQTLLQSNVVVTDERVMETVKDNVSGTRAKRQVLKDYANRTVIWNDGVFYTFNTTDESIQNAFKMGMKVWMDNTCIDFTENRTAKDKVVVLKTNECSANVGRIGGNQFLCLNDPTEGSAVHEIGHILGLFHTMARPDRDKFITILYHNVGPNALNNFNIMSWDYAEVYNLTYDYGSVMQYHQLSGSFNKQPTMIATEPHYQMTMGSAIISFTDILTVNKRYGCDAKCDKATSANCTNEGFPHPRNCSICICPSGYGGVLCDQRPLGCGEDLRATRKRKTLSHRIGYGLGLRDLFDFCNFMILAPEGRKIEVNVRSISLGYDIAGCVVGGVEIKAQKDQKRTGYRFCSVKGSGGPIVSSSSRLPIILYNRFTYMDVNLTYRYIG